MKTETITPLQTRGQAIKEYLKNPTTVNRQKVLNANKCLN